MLKNLINVGDFLELYIFLKRRERSLYNLLSRLFTFSKNRTKSAWSHFKSPPTHWWDIPQIIENWNFLISGNPQTDYYDYFITTFLYEKTNLFALSLGCGTGHRELKWAASGKFIQIDAIDLSPKRIEFAKKEALEEGFSHIINYQTMDFDKITEENKYDLIFCEQSLHHFSPMEKVVNKINRILKPDGLLLVNEYVGPNRFQWVTEQLYYTNMLLKEIPDKYKYYYNSRLKKRKQYKPGIFRMILSDPSEAIESENILPELNKKFRLVQQKEYGGTILHLLFNGIAQNFINEAEETLNILKKCFQFENELLHSKKIKSDFIFAVYKKEFE
ncbi:MAG: class I SAM-dependent methyltransferase [Ignavibacteria bacterium]|nr:class I SAM-dependent methyltransferase [Ignavibacteria bacterium]